VIRRIHIVAALGVLALGAFAVSRVVERRTTIREIRALRDGVYEARVAADSCRFSLALEEGRLQRFSQLVDTLHNEVRTWSASTHTTIRSPNGRPGPSASARMSPSVARSSRPTTPSVTR